MEENPVENGFPIKHIIESLLLVTDGPVSIARLASVVERPVEEVEREVLVLQEDYASRGLHLQRNRDLVQFVTAPEATPFVQRFLGQDLAARLSPAALEALSIVAYQQPITRPQIEAIRGVNCDGVIRTLLTHELIEEVGRLEQAGRPILYGTTFQFLQQFGLRGLDELPPLNAQTNGGTQ